MIEHQFLYMFYVLFAILIFVFLVNTIKDMYTGESFNKEFLARDVGMMIESSYIGNGELKVDYNLTKEYFVKMQDGVLLLRENLKSSYGSYLIAEGKDNLDFDLKDEKLRISKNKGVKIE